MTFIDTYITKLAGVFYARSKFLLVTTSILLLSVLIACAPADGGDDGGGSDDTYTVGGSVTGHTGDVSLDLTYGEKTETLKVAVGTDKFTFLAKLEANQSFAIEVTAPTGQTCRSSLTRGTIVDANVTNISVTCSTDGPHTVGGAVSGLENGETITLTLTPTGGNAETKDITGDSAANTDDAFTFDTELEAGATYTVTTTSPARKTCTVTPAGEQTMGDADADITVTCAINLRKVKITIIGLKQGENIRVGLSNDTAGTEDKDVTGDADENSDESFTFDLRIPEGEEYRLSLTATLTERLCKFNNAKFNDYRDAETMGWADANIVVECSDISKVIGRVVGLAEGETISLNLRSDFLGDVRWERLDIIGDAETSTDDSFAFNLAVPEGSSYTVGIVTNPAGKVCATDKTEWQIMGNQDASFVITCTAPVAVKGTVSGLAEGERVDVLLTIIPATSGRRITVTGDADENTDESFIFHHPFIPQGLDFTLTIYTSSDGRIAHQPDGKTCTVSPTGIQTTGSQDAVFTVTCVPTPTHSVSGTVTRADATSTVYVVLTASDDNAGTGATRQTVLAGTDGTFSFTGVLENKFYILEASSSIIGETCTSSVTTPVQITANVTGAVVTCTAPAAADLFLRIESISYNDELSLSTVNVFIGDTAITDTTGTPTQVVNGNADVIIVPNMDGSGNEGYLYDIPIGNGKHYAVTAATSSTIETCRVNSGGSGGPVADNVKAIIYCEQQ